MQLRLFLALTGEADAVWSSTTANVIALGAAACAYVNGEMNGETELVPGRAVFIELPFSVVSNMHGLGRVDTARRRTRMSQNYQRQSSSLRFLDRQMGVSEVRGTLFGVLIIRILLFRVL